MIFDALTITGIIVSITILTSLLVLAKIQNSQQAQHDD